MSPRPQTRPGSDGEAGRAPESPQPPWTIAALLRYATQRFSSLGLPSPRVDAEYLLAEALGCERLQLYLDHDLVPEDSERSRFRSLIQRRLRREPVAYIRGRKGFHALDLELAVDGRVLVPRPETEHLVDWLLEDLRPRPAPRTHVLDVGTGSGAIALAVKRARPDVDVVGVDISEDALQVARNNRERLGLAVDLRCTDLVEGLEDPAEGWSAIAANLPYVPTGQLAQLEPEVAVHEPRLALDGGPDGLDLIRRLIRAVAARSLLRPWGALYLEVGPGQAEKALRLMQEHGMEQIQVRADWAGILRTVRGLWPQRGSDPTAEPGPCATGQP